MNHGMAPEPPALQRKKWFWSDIVRHSGAQRVESEKKFPKLGFNDFWSQLP